MTTTFTLRQAVSHAVSTQRLTRTAVGTVLTLGLAVNAEALPIITSVAGCLDSAPETLDCPTAGAIAITISGTGFGLGGTTARVGLTECAAIDDTSDTVHVCVLPEGSGGPAAVQVVDGGGIASDPVALLTYAPPSIASVSGCSGGDGTGCARAGNDIISIAGSNFGGSGATVLVGGSECVPAGPPPTQTHTMITCALPPGTGSGNSLKVVSSGGAVDSTPGSISYEPCPPGTFVSGLTCVPCDAGFFASGENATSCDPCAPGTVQNSIGSQTCFDCPADTAQPDAGQTECLACPAGKTADPGSSECSGNDALQCWKSKDLKTPKFVPLNDVDVSDELGADTVVDVKKPGFVCLPADVESSGVLDASDYRCCYKSKGAKLDPAVEVSTTDAVGAALNIELKQRKLLCEPCSVVVP